MEGGGTTQNQKIGNGAPLFPKISSVKLNARARSAEKNARGRGRRMNHSGGAGKS